MALDHVRDYFFYGAFSIDPLDPAQTTPWIYATRWITHLCAPTFVFLSGVSVWLQRAKGKVGAELSLFLLARGLWLIALELTVISFGWAFSLPYPPFLQVIWAIGWSMIALAGLLRLPRRAILLIGVIIITGHNLLDPLTPQQFGGWAPLWIILHDGGPVMGTGGVVAIAAYPVLPWVGVIALGYGMGAIFAGVPEKRDRTVFILGVCMLGAFFALRGLNLYGNPLASVNLGPYGAARSWADQPSRTAQVMAFFDVQKYPPSLHYLLVTLGLVFALWPLFVRLRGAAGSLLSTFGAVPLFFYVLHIYLVHGLAMVANAASGRDISGFFNYLANGVAGSPLVEGLGFSLPGVYLAWAVVLAILFPPCRSWAQLKRTRHDWWLSYL